MYEPTELRNSEVASGLFLIWLHLEKDRPLLSLKKEKEEKKIRPLPASERRQAPVWKPGVFFGVHCRRPMAGLTLLCRPSASPRGEQNGPRLPSQMDARSRAKNNTAACSRPTCWPTSEFGFEPTEKRHGAYSSRRMARDSEHSSYTDRSAFERQYVVFLLGLGNLSVNLSIYRIMLS